VLRKVGAVKGKETKFSGFEILLKNHSIQKTSMITYKAQRTRHFSRTNTDYVSCMPKFKACTWFENLSVL